MRERERERERESWLHYFNYVPAVCGSKVSDPCFFLTVPWVGPQCVIVALPGEIKPSQLLVHPA